MSKDNTDDPRNPSRRTPGTPEPKPNRPGETSDTKNKQPSIHDQIRSFLRSERLDGGYGVYQPSLRNRGNVDPLDQLLGRPGDEAEDTESAKPDEGSEDPRINPQSSKRKRR